MHFPAWFHDRFEQRFGRPALERHANYVRHAIYQSGGRDRFIPVAEIEAKYLVEADLVVYLAETYLCTEVLVTDMPRADLDDGTAFRDPIEVYFLRTRCTEPHVRIRPEAMRLTEKELLDAPKSGRRRGPRRG